MNSESLSLKLELLNNQLLITKIHIEAIYKDFSPGFDQATKATDFTCAHTGMFNWSPNSFTAR